MRKLLRIMMAAAVVFAVSCKKDTTTETLSSTDAKNALDASTDNISNDLNGITNTQGYVAVNNLQGTSTPFGNPVKYAIAATKCKTLKALKALKSEDFNFDQAKGEWNYVDSNKSVQRVANSTITDRMVLHLPSDSTKPTVLDATLTISQFTVKTIYGTTEWGYPDTTILPTRIAGNITVSGAEVASVDFTAAWTENGDPSSINGTVSLNPYSMHVGYAQSGAKETLDFNIKNGSKTLAGTTLTLTYPSSTDLSKPDNVDGSVQLDNIKASGSVNIKAMDLLFNPKASDYNTNIKISFSKVDNGAKIGDLKMYDETDSLNMPTVVPYIVFGDGSKEPAKTYVDKLANKLQNMAPSSVSGL